MWGFGAVLSQRAMIAMFHAVLVSCAVLQVFLAMQDRQIALRGKENWYKDYYMPTPCDGLVIAGQHTHSHF